MNNQSILLVEDDPTSVLLTQRIYQKSGLHAPLHTVVDAEEALAYLSGEHPYTPRDRYPLPALVLLDLKLPRMSGLQLLARLRGQPQFKNLPVVVLTTSRDPEDIQMAYDAGANTYLVKPITLEDLLDLGHTFDLQPESGPCLLLLEERAEDRERIARALASEFPDARLIEVGSEAEMSRALEGAEFDLAIAAYRPGPPEGFSSLGQFKTRCPDCPLILHVAAEDEDAAHEAFQEAWDELVIRSGGSPARLARAARIQLDLAGRRRAARQAEERYHHLTASLPIGLFRATLRGQVVEANPVLRQLLGYGERPFSTAYILPDLLVEDAERAAWQAGMQQAGTLRGFEAQIYAANHEIRWVEINAQLVRDAQGSPSFIQGSLEDVNPRKQAEAQLRASEEKYRGLIEQSLDGILLVDEEGKVVEWNARLEALTGIPRRNALGRDNWEFLQGVLARTDIDFPAAVHREAFMRTLRTGKITAALRSLDVNFSFADRPPMCLQALSFTIGTGRGYMLGCVIRDITERKRTNEALIESERRFRETLDNVHLAAIALDLQGNITYANDYLLDLTGWLRGELMGKNWFELFIPDGLEIRQYFDNFIATGLIGQEFIHHENEILTRGGERRLIHWNNTLLKGSDGSVSGVVSIGEDITERKQAEEALVQEQSLMRALLDNSPDFIYFKDLQSRAIRINQSLAEMVGLSDVEQAVGRSDEEFFDPEFADYSREIESQIIQTGEAKANFEEEVNFPGRPPMWLSSTQMPYRDETGRIIGTIGISRDITATKQVALKSKQQAELLELAHDSIFVRDLDERIIYWNRGSEHLYGWGRDEALGKVSYTLLQTQFPIPMDELKGRLFETGAWEGELLHTRQDGSQIIVASRWSLQKDDQGRPAAILEINNNISERKQAEEALRSSERQYRTIIEQFVEGFMLVDEKGTVIEWNKAMEATTGISAEEALGKPYWDVQYRVIAAEHRTPQRHAQLKNLMQKMLSAGNSPYFLKPVEAFVQKADGERRTIQQITFPIQFEHGYRIGSILQDITERKKREHELQVIASLSSALRSADTRLKMAPVIVDQMISLLDADAGSFETIDMVSGESLVEQVRGAWAPAAGARIPLDSGLNTYIIESGQPYHTNQVLKDPRVVMADLYGDCQAAAGAPMIAQGQMIGFLWIGRKNRVSENEVQLLAAIADIAANAIHRANLHEQSERSVQRLAALHEIDIAISSSLDLQITLRVLLEQVIGQLHVDAADVLLLSGASPQLNYAAGRGFKTRLLEKSTVRVGESFAGRAAMTRNTVEIPDLDTSNDGSAIYKILANEGFHSYFAVPLFAKGQVTGVLEVHLRARFTPDQDWLDFLRTLGGQAAIAIDNATLFNDLQRLASDLILAYDETIEGWSRALDLRDKETEGHTLRVTEMTESLAHNMGVSDADMVHVRRGALLHDIGKMGVPDAILLKPGKLTEEEWERMRKHPVYAYELLYPIKYLRPALDIPYNHHEKWDGTGYPRGLRGEQIPLAARLFAVIDVWDALSYPRPYRPEAWPQEKIRAYIADLSGTQFDPQVVIAFFRLLDNQ